MTSSYLYLPILLILLFKRSVLEDEEDSMSFKRFTERNMTQEELAQFSKVNEEYISELYNNEARFILRKEIEQIAETLKFHDISLLFTLVKK